MRTSCCSRMHARYKTNMIKKLFYRDATFDSALILLHCAYKFFCTFFICCFLYSFCNFCVYFFISYRVFRLQILKFEHLIFKPFSTYQFLYRVKISMTVIIWTIKQYQKVNFCIIIFMYTKTVKSNKLLIM